jgi:hypothetical protein
MEGCPMIEYLQALQAIIEDAVETAACEVTRVTITAGQPSAPIGSDCTSIYLWTDQVVDFNQNDPNECLVASRLTMNYQIHTCYIATKGDETDAQHLVAAECLYELMSLVWCALVAAKDTGAFGDCAWVSLEPLDIQPRQGTNVSALGGVTIPLDC